MNRTDDLALLVGRCCIAALFIPDGFGKLMNFSRFAASLAGSGLPFPEAWAAAAIFAALGGGIAVLLGIQVRWAALLLVAFVVIATALNHRYWEFADEARRRANAGQFWKNVSLVGGLLFLHVAGAGRYRLSLGRDKASTRR
jgi:putative oxidoreductase